MKSTRFRQKAVLRAALSLAFSVIAIGAQAQESGGSAVPQATPPPPAAPRSVTVPTPVERTLKNGLRVIVIEHHSMPLVAAQLMIKNGSEVDPAALSGVADLTAELLTKGTKTRTAPEIAREIEALGGALNTGAGWDASRASVNVLSSKTEPALAILADLVRNPVFKDEEIERLRQQYLDTLSVGMNTPGTLASWVAARVVFGDAAYGHSVSGTQQSIARIKREDLVKLHATYYRPDNAILVIGGDIKADAAFSLAEKYFGDWPKPLTPVSIIGDRIIYPPEFSPLVTSRPRKQQRSLIPPTKFVKIQNAIPNMYIVVLNDDVVSSDAPLDVRRARITAIAYSHAQAYGGKVGYVYETALKGYSIELPNEAAAIALSQNPQVRWVEEDGRAELQSNPPWGLNRIDQSGPVETVAHDHTTAGLLPEAVAEIQKGSSSEQRVVVVDMPGAGQAAVLFARRGIARTDATFFSGLVANSVLTGYSGRLNQEIRIKRGLSYGAGSQLQVRRDTGLFVASAQTKNQSGAEVASLLLGELRRLSNEPVGETELVPRKAVLIGNFGRALETTEGLVGQIAGLALYGLGLDETNRYINNVQAISAADVQRFGGTSLDTKGASIIIVGDAKEFLPELQKQFKNVEVIPIAELDLNQASLHKSKAAATKD